MVEKEEGNEEVNVEVKKRSSGPTDSGGFPGRLLYVEASTRLERVSHSVKSRRRCPFPIGGPCEDERSPRFRANLRPNIDSG